MEGEQPKSDGFVTMDSFSNGSVNIGEDEATMELEDISGNLMAESSGEDGWARGEEEDGIIDRGTGRTNSYEQKMKGLLRGLTVRPRSCLV